MSIGSVREYPMKLCARVDLAWSWSRPFLIHTVPVGIPSPGLKFENVPLSIPAATFGEYKAWAGVRAYSPPSALHDC